MDGKNGFDVKAFEERLKEIAKELIAHPENSREYAISEIGANDMPNASYIIDAYPEFDGIDIRFVSKGMLDMRMHINPRLLLDEEEVLHWASRTYESWINDLGATEEEV